MASHETDIPDAPGNPAAPNEGAHESTDSEDTNHQDSRKRRREKIPWDLQLNITVTEASPEGQLTEMRDNFLHNLAEEGCCLDYPFGNKEKRIHGIHIKHHYDNSADMFCPFRHRLNCPFRVKVRMNHEQLLIWTAFEHDHDPKNDKSKHMKVAVAKKVKLVVAKAPIGNAQVFIPNFISDFISTQ